MEQRARSILTGLLVVSTAGCVSHAVVQRKSKELDGLLRTVRTQVDECIKDQAIRCPTEQSPGAVPSECEPRCWPANWEPRSCGQVRLGIEEALHVNGASHPYLPGR